MLFLYLIDYECKFIKNLDYCMIIIRNLCLMHFNVKF